MKIFACNKLPINSYHKTNHEGCPWAIVKGAFVCNKLYLKSVFIKDLICPLRWAVSAWTLLLVNYSRIPCLFINHIYVRPPNHLCYIRHQLGCLYQHFSLILQNWNQRACLNSRWWCSRFESRVWHNCNLFWCLFAINFDMTKYSQ